jgi:hypothetical protein
MSARLLLGLCLGSLALAAGPVRAEPSPYLNRDNPLAGLLPSAPVMAARERSDHEQALALALAALPHVERAQVLIGRPEPLTTPLDAPPPASSVWVHLVASEPVPSAIEIERTVRARLPDLAPEQLHVVRTAPLPVRSTEAALARVGPFMVARESSGALRATLIACLGANALLASLLLVRRRAR